MTLYLVVGPPAAGKSTWVRQRARSGDITIDFDAIASTLAPAGDGHDHPDHVKAVTKAARRAAIDTAVSLADRNDVYVIHSTPGPATIQRYRRLGARVVCVDPGEDVVMERVGKERPWRMRLAAAKWYEGQRAGVMPYPSKLETGDSSRSW